MSLTSKSGLANLTTHSAEETIAFGRELAQTLPRNAVVCFFGDLGAGKTTLIKGIVSGATQNPAEAVVSPTFVYLNQYPGDKPVFHFDLYRLQDSDEFLSMGFDEVFQAGGITCIEWSERIADLLPPDHIRIEMHHAGGETRTIEVSDV